MLEWIKQHGTLMWWLGGVSVVLFVGTILALPPIISRIPEDYFAHERRPDDEWGRRHRVVAILLQIGKNIAGGVFMLAGIAMLVLPGQGLLTILIGFLLLDFPGKYRMEKWLISRGRVLHAINWYRGKRGRPPLRVDGVSAQA